PAPLLATRRKPEAMPDDISLPRILQLALEKTIGQSSPSSPQEPSCGDLRVLAERVACVLEENGREAEGSQAGSREAILLRQLRASVVAVWAESPSPPPPAEMVRLLDAFDRVPRAPREPDAEGAAEADARLRIPTTPELIVELAHDLRSPLTSILFLTDA